MKKNRRKLALLVTLALLFGSAAASAANYAAGRGTMPSLAGASDALDIAASGAASAGNWIVARTRNAIGSAFSYAASSSERPSAVDNPPNELPMYSRGLPSPIDVDPRWAPSAPSALGLPDGLQTPSFNEGIAATGLPDSVAVASLSPTSLPSSGTTGNSASVSSVPELPPYAMLITGMSLLAAAARRRKTS